MAPQGQTVDLESRRRQRRVDELLRELAEIQEFSIERRYGRAVDWGRMGRVATDIAALCSTIRIEIEGPIAA